MVARGAAVRAREAAVRARVAGGSAVAGRVMEVMERVVVDMAQAEVARVKAAVARVKAAVAWPLNVETSLLVIQHSSGRCISAPCMPMCMNFVLFQFYLCRTTRPGWFPICTQDKMGCCPVCSWADRCNLGMCQPNY